MDPITHASPETPAGIDLPVPAFVPFKTRAASALARHNPFYLLSAMSMLAACLLLANSLSWSPIPFPRLLGLLGILNVYELLLLALGLYLFRRHSGGSPGGAGEGGRDATQLLFLASVFLADAAFLNSEVVTYSLKVGLLLNAALLLLALGKFLLTARVLKLPLDPGRLLSVAFLFTLLFGLPAWLKTVDRAQITGLHLYACWWAATAAAAAYDLLTGRAASDNPSSHRWGLLTTLFIVLPMLSLLTHIGILHYVYNEPFIAPDAAPVLLLLAIVLGRVPGPVAARIGIPSAQHARRVQALLPLFAVMVSSSAHFTLRLPLAGAISPLVLTIFAAVLTYAFTLFRPYALRVLLGSAAATIAYLLSPSAATLASAAQRALALADRVFSFAMSLIPSTRLGWGLLSLIAAFALLALGAHISIRRPQSPSAQTHPAPT